MAVVCKSRNVHVTVEQPMNSLIYAMPDVSSMLIKINAHRYITYGGAFGSLSRKPFELYSTWPFAAMQFLIIS